MPYLSSTCRACGLALVLLAGCASQSATRSSASQAGTATDATYDVYAVRYGTLPQYRLSGLIAGADSSRRLDIAMMIWLMKGNGRTVILDAGFYRARSWRAQPRTS